MDAVTITLVAIVAIVAITLTFGFANGFRDANGTIATSVSTHALTPHIALAMATSMNLLGALIGTGVAQTVGAEIIATPSGSAGMAVILAAVVGATLWSLLTWRLGLPSSSSYALIGGLIGAAVAATTGVHWDGVATKVLLPMVLSPLIAFIIAIAVHTGIMWLFRGSRRVSALNRGFRLAQTFSTAGVALGHGLQDAQKTMGVIVLALVSIGYQDSFDVPLWVILSVAAAMAAGTYAGGWRFLRTPSRGVVQLDAPRAFAGEVSAASALYVTAAAGVPVSAMQAMISGGVGAATTRGRAPCGGAFYAPCSSRGRSPSRVRQPRPLSSSPSPTSPCRASDGGAP